MTHPHIVLFSVILNDGLGDFGNMLNMMRIISHHPTPISFSSIVICTPDQIDLLRRVTPREYQSMIHFQIASLDPQAYMAGNLFHVGMPGPGLVSLDKRAINELENSDLILEFPIAYPYRSQVMTTKQQRKTKRILEYGRSPGKASKGITRTGFNPTAKGILLHPTPYLSLIQKQINHTHDWTPLLKTTSKDTTESPILYCCYVKPDPTDPNNNYTRNYIVAVLLNEHPYQSHIDLFCSVTLTGVAGLEAILNEFGIGSVEIHRPNSDTITTVIGDKSKRLRLFSGYRFSQSSFHTLLLYACSLHKKQNRHTPLFLAGCGDGSLTDIISIAAFEKDIPVVPFIKPIIEYHYPHLSNLEKIAKHQLQQPNLASAINKIFHLHTLDGFGVQDLVSHLNSKEIREKLFVLVDYIASKHNFNHTLHTWIKTI